MADNIAFTREMISQFISDPASIRGFELALSNVVTNTADIVEQAQVISNASFLVLTPESVLGKERSLALTAGHLEGVDAGPNGTFTVSLADTAVTPNTYGDTALSARVTVDQQGRVTGATEVPITIADVAGATPAADGTYASPTSITIINGVITAIS